MKIQTSVSDCFWALVDDAQIDFFKLGQICSAPVKVLLSWHDSEVPESALIDLQKHLGIAHEN